jgi:hypothetical protein
VVPYVVVVVEYVHCDCETVRRGRVVPEFVESRSLAQGTSCQPATRVELTF